MGWTSYHADIVRNGKVDRNTIKKILDEQVTWTDGNGSREPIKSALVGNVYYAAVQHVKPDGSVRVWCAVTLFSVNTRDYYNFAYKDMSEDMWPGECKCPVGILKVLTETESEWAKEWRECCWKYHAEQKEKQKEKRKKPSLGSLPLGTVIEFEIKGKEVFRARKINYWKFKRPVWSDGNWRFPTTVIPDDWKVVEEVEAVEG